VSVSRFVRPTPLTQVAAIAGLSSTALTASFLGVRYRALPDLLVVHFMRNGMPNGWQYKTWPRVMMPAFVQIALALTLGSIGLLLLSRAHGEHEHDEPDVRAAAVAAEAVALLGAIWIVFQGYVSLALAAMWERERAGLGAYTTLEIVGLVLTLVVAVRAHLRLGRPDARPFVAEHWRFGQLYKNPDDPALFVPTRHGGRWTLNFGRPVAAALMGVILMIGIVAPAVILGLSLR
jgi:uncharacterized membrane protein